MANSKDEGVSINEFARQVGRSATWISRKTKDGTIPRGDDGKIPLRAGLAAFEKMQQRAKAVKKIQGKPIEADDGPLSEASNAALNVTAAMNKARLAREVATAKIKDLEYKKLKGEYVAVTEVEADAREAASMLRNFALSAPARYSALLENRTQREAEEVLENIFQDLLKTINGSRFAKE